MAHRSITILGDGQMGLVLASTLAQPENRLEDDTPGLRPNVTLWGYDRASVADLDQNRTSPRIPGLELPPEVRITHDMDAALDGASLAVVAIPTQFIRPTLEKHTPAFRDSLPLISVSKGFETQSQRTPLTVLEDVVGERPLCVLAGPTVAAELARCLPATMVAASTDAELASVTQTLFTTSWLRVYTSDDPLGVEVAGATKNVIAIAAGILDGLQAGINAKSALLARGLAEITRLGIALGATPDTFFGLAGAGDLATTCFHPEGRNRSLGEALGKGEALDHYLQRTNSVVEGVDTSKAVLSLAEDKDVDMPIVRAVNRVLFGGLDPIDAITSLMSREPKAERVG